MNHLETDRKSPLRAYEKEKHNAETSEFAVVLLDRKRRPSKTPTA